MGIKLHREVTAQILEDLCWVKIFWQKSQFADEENKRQKRISDLPSQVGD